MVFEASDQEIEESNERGDEVYVVRQSRRKRVRPRRPDGLAWEYDMSVKKRRRSPGPDGDGGGSGMGTGSGAPCVA